MNYQRFWVLVGMVVVIGSVAFGISYIQGGISIETGSESPSDKADARDKPQNVTKGPTEERYVNIYRHETPPKWIPMSNFSFGDHMEPAYEFTRYPYSDPTSEDFDAAWSIYNRSFEAAKEEGWFEFEQALEDGYIQGSDPWHYVNLTYSTRNGSLNPHKPEVLVYYDDPDSPDNKILAGYMYHKKIGSDREGEQVGGPLTVWHSHEIIPYAAQIRKWVSERSRFKNESNFFETYGLDYEDVDEYFVERERTSEMFHVWFMEHPEGPFATRMAVPDRYIEEPEKMSEEEFKDHAMENYKKYFKANRSR